MSPGYVLQQHEGVRTDTYSLYYCFLTTALLEMQEDGTVMAVLQEDGSVAWTFSCKNVKDAEFCTDTILGSSSVSPLGLVYYYSDVFGNVKALQLGTGDSIAPTQFPSMLDSAPPSQVPSRSPTGVPTYAPTMSPSVSQKPSAADASPVPTVLKSSSPTTAPVTPAPVPDASTPAPVGASTPSPVEATSEPTMSESTSGSDKLSTVLGFAGALMLTVTRLMS